MRVTAYLCGFSAALVMGVSAQAVELRLSHSSQETLGSELHTTAWLFQKYMQDFGPNFQVTIFPNNQLGQEREVYEAMQLGSGANCAISGTAILGNFNQKVGVVDLPFLWQDYAHVARVLDGEVGDALKAELHDSGFEVIAWLSSWGYRNVATNKPIESVADLKGLKIRTIPTDTYVKAVNAMGANATPMAFGEVYTAMETGVLDGLEHSAAMVFANKFYEVAHYYTLTRHLFGPMVFACSASFVESLSEVDKAKLIEAATFARDAMRALAPVRENAAMASLTEAGMVIKEIDVTLIKEAAGPVQDELATALNATDLLAKIRAAAE